jgi:N-acetylneuraminic acid mutarotase
VNGADVTNTKGTYGTLGTAASTNVPGARVEAVSWTDASGNLWLFGGFGYDSTGADGPLNDLWKYSPTKSEWTWVSGANVYDQVGNYGTLGTAASTNVPGARYSAVSWIDASGNLWLFGGAGLAANSEFNDLWKYNPTLGEWTWVSGANIANQKGTYGTLGAAASTNVPGGRSSGSGWADASGNFWLFGGNGYASTSSAGELNDLWEYQP